jgi:transcription elongation GreA/GreB family factor
MTPGAADALRREIDSLVRELDVRGSAASLPPDPAAPIPSVRARSARTLERLRAMLDSAAIDDRPDAAVVGRRVTIRDASDAAGGPSDGSRVPMTFSLVLPGDGDPSLGWVSIESPLGTAVAGRRPGSRTVVAAPGGRWDAEIVRVE